MPSAFANRATDFDLKSKELLELVESHSSLKLKAFSGEIGEYCWDSATAHQKLIPRFTSAFNLGVLIRDTYLNGYYKEHPDSAIIIAIRTLADHTLFAATAGEEGRTGPGNWGWAARKEKVVKALGKSSFWAGRLYVEHRTPSSQGDTMLTSGW